MNEQTRFPLGHINLFRSKLTPPVLMTQPFHRERLIHKLNMAWDYKLTILTAPAGYGKTSLLQSWANSQTQPIGWLRLDPGDNDLRRFLFYLLHALPLPPDAPNQDKYLAWIQEADSDRLVMELEAFAAQWFAGLEQIEQQLMVVIDGSETIHHPDLIRFYTLFLRFGPPNVHVVLSGRNMPRIELPRSEEGGCQMIHAGDAALSDKEMLHYIHRRTSVYLSDTELADLEARTRGWFIGVNAYIHLIREQGYVCNDPSYHSKTEHEIGAYFSALLGAENSPSLLPVLMRLATARQLDDTLARLLTECTDPSLSLAELFRKGWFLYSVKNQPERYVFHPMFSAFLQQELKKTDAKTYMALQRINASHAEREGKYNLAVEHALAGRDQELAANFLLRYAHEALLEGNLLPLLERFTESELRQWPDLAVLYADSLIHARRIHAAEHITDLLGAVISTDKDARLVSTGEPIRGYWAAIRSMIHFSRGETEQGLNYMIQAAQELSGPGRLHRHSIHFHPHTASILRGKYGHYGVLKSALVTFEYCLPRWGQQDTSCAIIWIGLGECYYEEGKLNQSEEHLQKGLSLSLDLNNPGLFVPAYIAWARLKWRKGEKEAAWTALQEARRQLLKRNLGDRLAVINACEVKLQILEQDIRHVRKWMKAPAIAAVSSLPYERMYEAFALLRAYMFLGKTAEAQALAEKLLHSAIETNHPQDLIEVYLTLAQILHRQGNTVQALEKLDRALAEAHAQGYLQMLVDEGGALMPLLNEYRKQYRLKGRAELMEFAGAILKAMPKDESAKTAAPSITAALTQQEKRVFELLLKGEPNRSIQEKLMISNETVKIHCRHIYRKLGVANRKEALEQYSRLQKKKQ